MLKTWSRHVSLMLTIVLLIVFLMPVTAFAGSYVALGDSISYGLTDPNGGYTVLFHDNIVPGYSYKNLSMPGYTTSSLLDVIGDSANTTTLRSAHVFTISIGSNNLLGPAIQAILGLYGLKMDDPKYVGDLDGKIMLHDLAWKVKQDWADNDAVTPEVRFSWLMNPLRQESLSLNATWVAGTALFKLHWPIIMTRIRLRAPLAKIYVDNLYNPLMPSLLTPSNLDFKPLYVKLDGYMSQINSTIVKGASFYRYRVADIHAPFADPARYAVPANAPVNFNIPLAIAIAKNPSFNPDDPASFLPFFLSCDPHPTTAGHVLIYQQIKKIL